MTKILLVAALAAASPLSAAEFLPAVLSELPRRSGNAAIARRRADGPAVKAVWRSASYDGPPRRYDCVPALQAVAAALDAVEARSGSRGCSGSRGLFAAWSALTPVKAGETPREPVVDAVWVHATLQYSLSDPRGCSAFAETFELMLDALPVRAVNETVFCQPGSSYISASFDYLAAADR